MANMQGEFFGVEEGKLENMGSFTQSLPIWVSMKFQRNFLKKLEIYVFPHFSVKEKDPVLCLNIF